MQSKAYTNIAGWAIWIGAVIAIIGWVLSFASLNQGWTNTFNTGLFLTGTALTYIHSSRGGIEHKPCSRGKKPRKG
jgi:hypothetical protein